MTTPSTALQAIRTPGPDQQEPAILAEGLAKRFGTTLALEGVDLAVRRGSVCALLGPNGAGKTTIVRILTTLLRPDAGRAWVAGLDVVAEADRVRYRIGLAGQQAAVDELLTGRANLEMVGRLYQLPSAIARRRAAELLERFELVDAADRIAKTYSGGMRRRLDLAASLVAAPPVLFLDEPTTGLDPHSRGEMWNLIGELVAGGTTLLLTTQYMEEADRLADSIVVIDTGRVIATGTAGELKSMVGGERIDIEVHAPEELPAATAALRRAVGAEPISELGARRVSVDVTDGPAALGRALRELEDAGVVVDDVALRRPTLDEVFLRLTGSPAAEAASRGIQKGTS